MTDRRSGAGRGKENSRRKTRRGNRDSRTGTDGKARGGAGTHRNPGRTAEKPGREERRTGGKPYRGAGTRLLRRGSGACRGGRPGIGCIPGKVLRCVPGLCGSASGVRHPVPRPRRSGMRMHGRTAGTRGAAPEAGRADRGGGRRAGEHLRSRGIPASCGGWEGKHEAAQAARQTERAGEWGNRTDGTTGTTGEKPGGQGNR